MPRWSKRTFAAQGLTQYPPGPHLGALTPLQRIRVTSPGFDDIGSVLTSMGVEWEPFTDSFDCEILMVNCGTANPPRAEELRTFVDGGGCVYASDRTSDLLTTAFPGVISFAGSGQSGGMSSVVMDAELRPIVGRHLEVTFDMGGWSRIDTARGVTILESRDGGFPIMVEVELGKGVIFYTSFHNHAQATSQEQLLLRLLVLKQIGRSTKSTVEQAGRSLGLTDLLRRKPTDRV